MVPLEWLKSVTEALLELRRIFGGKYIIRASEQSPTSIEVVWSSKFLYKVEFSIPHKDGDSGPLVGTRQEFVRMLLDAVAGSWAAFFAGQGFEGGWEEPRRSYVLRCTVCGEEKVERSVPNLVSYVLQHRGSCTLP